MTDALSFNEKEAGNYNHLLKDQLSRVDEFVKKNQDLRRNLHQAENQADMAKAKLKEAKGINEFYQKKYFNIDIDKLHEKNTYL